MTALYSEIEPYPAQWLRNLCAADMIAPGEVIEADIRTLTAERLAGATQAHFFAGIGVWSYALRLAGWPDDLPVWTGSCPCQPFSVAGRRKGKDDARHLWPDWFKLIEKCSPPVIFGEQVASPDGLAWFDTVRADLEGAGYAVGAADMCAAGVGAPHIRQRLYFVAIADGERCEGLRLHLRERQSRPAVSGATRRGAPSSSLGMADGGGEGLEVGGEQQARGQRAASERGGAAGVMGNTSRQGSGWNPGTIFSPQREGPGEGDSVGGEPYVLIPPGSTNGAWRRCEWVYCRDEKWRPIEPGSFPLAHGASARVGRTRAYGNAIVPQVAETFIRAVTQCL